MKIFVSYEGGTGGRFLGVVFQSFYTENISLLKADSGHWNSEVYVWDLPPSRENIEINPVSVLDYSDITFPKAIQFVKDNLYKVENSKEVVCTHVMNFNPVLEALPEVKWVRLSWEKGNHKSLDQIAYNFIYKNFHADFQDKMEGMIINTFRKNFYRLSTIPNVDKLLSQPGIWISNPEFFACIYKMTLMLGHTNSKVKFYKEEYKSRVIDVKFEELMSKSLIDRLDELADFSGVQLTPYRRKTAISLIDTWVDNQTLLTKPLDLRNYF